MNAPYTPLLAPTDSEEGLQAAMDWSTSLARTLIDSQRVVWETVFAVQKAMFDVQQELWDEWAARFAGGVPIDG